MSYILDALRKAEMERELSRVPGITSRQPFAQSIGRYPVRSWMVAAAALAIGAGTTWGLTRFNAPTQAQAQAVVPAKDKEGNATQSLQSVAVSTVRKTKPAAAESEDKVVETLASAPLLVPVAMTSLQVAAPAVEEKRPTPPITLETNPREAIPVTEAKIENMAVPAQRPGDAAQPGQADSVLAMIAAEAEQGWPTDKPTQTAPSEQPEAIESDQSEGESSVETEKLPPLLSTLPYRFQSTMPPIVINAQAYAEDVSARFVIINMKKYREGQSTPEGVVIEQIGKEQLILSYHGQSFRMQR